MSLNFDDAARRHGRITIDFDAKRMSDLQIEILAALIDDIANGKAGVPGLGSYKINARVYDAGHRRSRILGKVSGAGANHKTHKEEYIKARRENGKRVYVP